MKSVVPISSIYASLWLPHTQQGFNRSWMGGSSWGLKVADSLMINEVRLCESVYKCVRMFALRQGVKWLRKTTGSSGTAKSLPVTNHCLFKQHIQMSPRLRGMKFSPSLPPTPLTPLCLHLPANLIISADRCCSFVVLFFPFHMSDVMSCIFNQLLFSQKFVQTRFLSRLFSQFHFTY